VAFAAYLLFWWFFALDMERMEAVEIWGAQHGINWSVSSPGGRTYVEPGQILHPGDF
jgi:hypothetical protein